MTAVGLPALDVANAYVEIDQIIMVTVAVIVAFSALFVLINSSRRFLAVIVGVIWIMAFINQFPQASRGIMVIPALLITQFPPWFAGIALLGVFIGGLVPAAGMAISQANLLARNVIKEFKPNLTEKGETQIAKWGSAVFKFLALAFVFAVPAGYALQFYLVGAIVIIQLLPAIFIGLYTDWLKAWALIAGAAVSVIVGIYMVLVANNFGAITTTLYPTPLGRMYIGIIVLGLNLVIAFGLSAVLSKRVPLTATPKVPEDVGVSRVAKP